METWLFASPLPAFSESKDIEARCEWLVVAQRRTTGLSGLDAQISGGVPVGSVHVLIGQPMNAFELFAYHFAAGATKDGGVVFLTTERQPDEIEAGIARVGGDTKRAQVVALPKAGKWALPKVAPKHRYIVDDLARVALEAGFDATLKRLEAIREEAKQEGVEVLVTVTEGLLEPSQEVRLRLWADGVLELGFDRQGFGLYPFLKVTKMRGVPESSRFILFKETEAGLFMESTRRVF